MYLNLWPLRDNATFLTVSHKYGCFSSLLSEHLALIFVIWFFKSSFPFRDDDPLSSHIKKDHYLNSIDFIGKKDGFPWYFSVFEFDILMSGKNTLHLSVLKSKYR